MRSVQSSFARAGLLEREQPLRVLRRAAERTRRGSGEVITVRAAAGMGKTSVLAELCHHLDEEGGATIVRVSGRQGIGRSDALARAFVAGIEESVSVDRWSRSCTGAAGRVVSALTDTPAVDGTLLVHGLGWLAVNAAATGPLVIVVDDAHFAEPLGRALIGELALRAPDGPILLLAAERDDSSPVLAEHPSVHLDPLSATALEALAVGRLGAAAAGCGPSLSELSGGNPLRASRLVDRAASIEHADDVIARLRTAAGSGGRQPDVLGDPPLAEVVAVAAASATCGLVSRVLDLTSAEVVCLAAEIGLVREGERLRFPHPLDEAEAYQRLPADRRARVHRQVAEALGDAVAPAELVGAHLARSGTIRDRGAVDVLLDAAEADLAAGHDEAAAEVLSAIDLTAVEPHVRHGVLRRRGDLAARTGDRSASRHLAEAEAAALTDDDRVDDQLALARWLFQEGRPEAALEHLDRSLDAVPPAQAHRLVIEWVRIGRFVLARREEAARRLAVLVGVDAGLDRLDAAARAEFAFEWAATVDRGASRVRQVALAAMADLDHAPMGVADGLSRWWACYALHLAGDNEAAEGALSTLVEDAQARGSRAEFVQAIALRSGPQFHLGRLDEASADAEFAIAAGRRAHRVFLPSTRGSLAQLRVWRGDLPGARRLVAAQHAEGTVGAGSDMLFLYGEAVVQLASGGLERALELLEGAGRQQELGGGSNPAMIPWRSLAAEALVGLGRGEEAAELARCELALAERFGAPGPIGIARRALALTADGDERVDLLRSATAAHEQGERRVEHVQAMIDLGLALLSRDKSLDARGVLRAAMGEAAEMDAGRLVVQARSALVAAGGRPRRAATRGLASITPAERRVLDLAARGLSNREIAESLFVGLKAVEWHLTSAYRKLGVRNRAAAIEAIAGLVRAG